MPSFCTAAERASIDASTLSFDGKFEAIFTFKYSTATMERMKEIYPKHA